MMLRCGKNKRSKLEGGEIMQTGLEGLFGHSSETDSVAKYEMFKACDMVLYGYDDTVAYWKSLSISGKAMYCFRMCTFNFRMAYWYFSGNFPEKLKQLLSRS